MTTAATFPTSPAGGADLEVTQTASRAVVDSPLTFTVTVRNLGPDTATGVTLRDVLPAGARFRGASGAGVCGAPAGGAVTCAAGPALAPGGTATYSLQIVPTARRALTNTAAATAAQADPSAANSTSALRVVPRLPRPVRGRRVNLTPLRGSVRLKEPGGRFRRLTAAEPAPVGSVIDARRGRVRVASAGNGRRLQRGTLSKGRVRVTQQRARRARGLTVLRLRGGSFRRCGSRTIRRVAATVKGRFRIVGRFSTATTRGARLTLTDRCASTLTTVQRGTVTVRDTGGATSRLRKGGRHVSG